MKRARTRVPRSKRCSLPLPWSDIKRPQGKRQRPHRDPYFHAARTRTYQEGDRGQDECLLGGRPLLATCTSRDGRDGFLESSSGARWSDGGRYGVATGFGPAGREPQLRGDAHTAGLLRRRLPPGLSSRRWPWVDVARAAGVRRVRYAHFTTPCSLLPAASPLPQATSLVSVPSASSVLDGGCSDMCWDSRPGILTRAAVTTRRQRQKKLL